MKFILKTTFFAIHTVASFKFVGDCLFWGLYESHYRVSFQWIGWDNNNKKYEYDHGILDINYNRIVLG